MTWNSRYLPPDPNLWQGRADIPPASCFFQIVQMHNLLENKPLEIHQPTFALLGFRCDEGVRRNHGRIGSAEGPSALRQALAKLPIQKQNFVCVDAGNITCADGDLEASQEALAEAVALLLEKGLKPILLGGGHEIAFGHYKGITLTYPQYDLGIINFDAHFDLRQMLPGNKGSSGTGFLQIAETAKFSKRRFDYNCIGIQHAGNIRQLFDTAKSYNTNVILADELQLGQQEKCVDFIDRIIDQNAMVYVSICMDVFSAAYAPGVSAVQPMGLTPWHVIPFIRQLAASGKVVSYDIAELCPRYDIDHRTAKLAATLLYEIMHHHNEQPRPW